MGIFEWIIRYFKSGQNKDIPITDQRLIRCLYTRKRWSVLLSVMIGYGMFYTCRVNMSVSKVPLIQEEVFTTEQIGFAGSIMLLVYAIGKFINGMLADKANIRRFMSFALLCSALVNIAIGFVDVFFLFAILWGLNGWFQSIGSAPSVVAISQWFSKRERGTMYGFWSVSHNLGEGLTFVVTTGLVAGMGWQWGFYGPGLICLVTSLIMFHTLADKPETYGLPPVHVYMKDQELEPKSSDSVIQWDVLKNPGVWILGLASASLYVTRYGMDNWATLYLVEGKGHDLETSGLLMSISPIIGFIGSATSGLISDKVFHSKRTLQALILGILQLCSLVTLKLSQDIVFDIFALVVYGYATGGLVVFVGGLMAVDIVPKDGVGTAMGLVGMLSYIGAAIQDSLSGYLIQASQTFENEKVIRNFEDALNLWVFASILSIILALGVRAFRYEKG